MSDDEDDLIPIGIPPLPGRPEAAKVVSESLNAIIEACGDGREGALRTASILFTVGLNMAQALGKTPEEIRELIDVELDRANGVRRQRVAAGRPRRVRCR